MSASGSSTGELDTLRLNHCLLSTHGFGLKGKVVPISVMLNDPLTEFAPHPNNNDLC